MAWRVMIEKTSTRFSHDLEVGAKCRVIRGLRASQVRTAGDFVGGVIVDDQVQLPPLVGLRDLFEEGQELLAAVPRQARLLDLAGGDRECGEQGGVAVADVVMGALSGSPGRRGKIGAVRSRAQTWDFSSTQST